MWRIIASIIAGLVAWGLVATLINFGVRAALPGYHAAEATLQFTLAMKIARLMLAALASIGAGVVVRAIAPQSRAAPWIVGVLLLCVFVPVHVGLWAKFPTWYHLAFLVPLAPLVALGASLRTTGGSSVRAAA